MQSVQNPGYKTFLAGEDLVAHRRVGIKSGTTTVPPEVEYVDAGVQAIGVTMDNAKSGQQIAIRLMSDNGTFLGVAADTFALDATLYAANDGKISDTSSGTAIGKALEAATAAGDIVEWVPFPVVSTTAATVSIADAGSYTSQTTVEAALQEIYPKAPVAITDPGNAGAIPVTRSGSVAITTTGAQTRTLAIPGAAGLTLAVSLDVDGGDCVITSAQAINQAGNNTITLGDAGDTIVLAAVQVGGALRWRVVVNDGCSLTTV